MANQITFIGRLLEIPPPAERCGDDAIAVVFKSNVLKVLSGNIDQDFMLLIIPCPELKGENFFVTNVSYRVQATDDLSEAEQYRLENKYEDERLSLFWVQHIARVNAE